MKWIPCKTSSNDIYHYGKIKRLNGFSFVKISCNPDLFYWGSNDGKYSRKCKNCIKIEKRKKGITILMGCD